MASAWRDIQDEEEEDEDDAHVEVRPSSSFRNALDLDPRVSKRGGAQKHRNEARRDRRDRLDRSPRYPASTCLTVCSSRPTEPLRQMDREAVVFLIDASPAMLRRAPGATTHAVERAHPDDAPTSKAATGRGGAGSAVVTYLDVALDCARGMLRDRVVAAPSDTQGVVFFNTKRTRGLDDHLDGLSARENVYVYHRAAPPSARRIQDLGDFIGSDGRERFEETVGSIGIPIDETGTEETSKTDAYYDALLRAHHVAREMLNNHPPTRRVAKRCLLFTNRDAPLPAANEDSCANEDGRELIAQWREFANVHKIDVRLFALPRTTSEENARDDVSRNAAATTRAPPLAIAPFDASKFYDHLLACASSRDDRDDRDDRDAGGTANEVAERSETAPTTGHELVAFDASENGAGDGIGAGGFGLDAVSRAFRKQTRRARKVRGGWFRFGDEEGQKIAVSLYAPFASAKRPKPVQVHCRDLSEVHCETVFVNTAVGAYVEREALRTKFAQIGDVRAVVTQDELAKAKRAVEEDGIHLFGFREDTDAFRETFLRWARTGRPARLMRPAGADDKSGAKSGHRAKYTSRGDGRLANGGDANADAHHHTSETTASAENGAAFSALVDAMRRKRRVGLGIAARVGSRDAGARGCVLVPAEDADGRSIGLHVIDAPFADDVRHPERNHDFAKMADAAAAAAADGACDAETFVRLWGNHRSAFHAAEGSRGATDAQVRAAEDVIDALAVHAYDPADIANPALARHYRVLECQALDVPWTDADERDADATRPPSAAELERVGVKEPVEAFKRAVYGENHDAEASEELSKPPQAKRSRPIGAGLADDGPIDFAALARLDRLERCTAATLKAYCKEHELKTTGVKSALAERVKAHALLGER